MYGCTTASLNVLMAVTLRFKSLSGPVVTSPREKLTNIRNSVITQMFIRYYIFKVAAGKKK